MRLLTPRFKNEHVTVILSLKDISLLAGTLEAVNVISERRVRVVVMDLGHINMFQRSESLCHLPTCEGT